MQLPWDAEFLRQTSADAHENCVVARAEGSLVFKVRPIASENRRPKANSEIRPGENMRWRFSYRMSIGPCGRAARRMPERS